MLKYSARRVWFRQQALRRNPPKAPEALQITISDKTLQKVLEFLFPATSSLPSPSSGQLEPSLRPTLKPWIGVIDQIIREDALFPKKLQTTAMRILKTLREEHGYTGCYNVVQEYVHEARIAADPTYVGRKSQNSRRKAEVPERAKSANMAVAPIPPQTIPETRASYYRLSQRPQRRRAPEDTAFFDWMRNVQQGATPLDILAKELSDVPLPELEVLLSAVTTGELSMRNRSVAVLSYLRGISCAPICSFLHISHGSLFRYWRQFRQGGTKMLFTRAPRSDKKSAKDSYKSAVFALMHSPPATHGINRTTWRMADLRSVLSEEGHPMSCDVIRTIIKEAGWRWRHARVVLTSNDPDYRSKVDAIKTILSELKQDEAFFSIDEYGPFAIKQKGGVKQVAPGEQYVVSQWQKSKGWMILTAALELSRNQVSHFYSRKKNTAEMIKMADVLRTQYRTCSTIYLSWDAASWHVSKDLVAYLARVNKQATEDGFPIVKTAPLPACAQFLNVIESVFSGMARAIIHNSDYPSVEVARQAIDQYFAQRNEHFSQHPKRAGQKLWGKERVPSIFAEGQNCKDPLYQYPFG
jgi:transposase